jgi:hypothetical protein
MPLDSPELAGTEKDGSASHEYCKYCYQNGEFTSPDITLDEMKERMTKIMDKEKLPEDILEAAISRLLTNNVFYSYYCQSGRLNYLLGKVPIKVILNPKSPLLGAAHYACTKS